MVHLVDADDAIFYSKQLTYEPSSSQSRSRGQV